MKTITFYSYKGGVGRSLALVNVATRLAEFGKRVCLLDFDLEAPGLHLKFARYSIKLSRGIVDYIYEFANSGRLIDEILSYSINLNIHPSKGMPITLIPAGNVDSAEYWRKLSSINWHDLLYENENGLAFFLSLKEKIKSELNPDFLLIDSRTGISEISGISLSLLADDVVVVAANNRENLGGAKKIINSITNPDYNLFGKIPKITFVLSRIPFTEKPEDKTREINLINRIRREYLYPKIQEINVIHSDRELEENEHVKIAYEKDESTSQSSRDYLTLFEKLTVHDLTSEEVKKFKDIRESERLAAVASNVEFPLVQRIEYLNKAIFLNDSNSELFILRANLNLELREEQLAINDIISAIGLNPNSYQAYAVYLNILFSFKRFEEVIRIANEVIEKFNAKELAYLYKATAFCKINELSNAEKNFSIVIQMNPELSEGFAGRANVKRLQGKYEAAKEDAYKALAINSEDIIALSTLAEIHAHLNDWGAFYIHLENALKINSSIMQLVINEEVIYKSLFDEERFVNLMNKYDVILNVDL